MPAASDSLFTFPTFPNLSNKPPKKPDLRLDIALDDDDIFSTHLSMASPTPYIKDEPDEMHFNPNRFVQNQNGFDMSQNFNDQFHASHGDSVNPSDLTMSGSFMNNQFGSHTMSSSFIMGQAGITDDELLSLGPLDDSNNGNQQQQPQPQQQQQQQFNGFGEQNNANANNIHGNQAYFDANKGGAVSMKEQHGQVNQIYSNTPDGAPIQSPFIHGFNYAQFQQSQQPHRQQQQAQGYPLSTSTPTGVQNGMYARRMPAALERQGSDSRSPLTAHAGLGNLHIGTPDSGSYPMINHRHQKSVGSAQWDHTPGSAQSWLESPMASPHGGGLPHAQISEVIASGKHASLPAKVDQHGTAYQTQEAKRKKRRESHNAVERRRRDNINERIHDLSRLVPQHRLEDEKVRKHIHNNGPLSPSIASSGISPPHATSLLAGGTGRRAAGNITTGLPIEEKDKGPNKGDILNGAVSWTRDLMWGMYLSYQREEQLKNLISELGGTWPFDEHEEESRMKTELVSAVEKNGVDNFAYTRGPGSGLRVPGHTNVAGDQLPKSSSPQGLSPAIQSGGSGSNSGGNGQPPFWMNQHAAGSSGHGSFSLKEEDEYDMEITS